jgi:ribonuclease-3
MSEERGAPALGLPAAGEVEEAVLALEERLGTALPDRALALAALTHKSYVNEHREEGLADNERLEFLGDAVIDLAVSHRLMERFPGAREGELSKMRAAVVDEQGLSAMARALDLGALLRLGRGEELTGGRAKSSLLADAMEAVVAAVFLGAGLGPVLGIVDRFLGEAFARAAAGTLDRDFKTQLQELAQSRLRATPRYRVVAEHGPDHSKTFEVETDLRGEVLGSGVGRSKKDAEQAAARLALELLSRRFAEGVEPLAGTGGDPAPATAGAEPVPPEEAGSALPTERGRSPSHPVAAATPAAATPGAAVAGASAPVGPASPPPAAPDPQSAAEAASEAAPPGVEPARGPARSRRSAARAPARPRAPRKPKAARASRSTKARKAASPSGGASPRARRKG